MKTPRISIASCALVLCALSACQTAKPKPESDIVTLPQPAVDEHVKNFLLDPSPGFVVRGRMGAWTELAPTLDLLAQSVPDDQLAALEGLVAQNAPADFPDLSLVDRTRTGWLHVSVVASEQTWGLLDLGVGLLSPYEPLNHWEVELLIPSTNPAEFASKGNIGNFQVEEAGEYVRLRFVKAVYRLGQGEHAIKEVDAKPRPWRMTPALARFLSEDAPGALYVRARDARLLAMSSGLYNMIDALRIVSAEYKQRLLARGLAFTLNVLSLSPLSVTEFEDHVLVLGGDAEAAGAFVDVTSTRTAFGRRVQAAGASTSVALPTFSDDVMPMDRVVVDTSFSFDLAAADDLYAGILRQIHGDSVAREPLRALPYALQQMGPLGALAALASAPLYAAALMSVNLPSEFIGDARPIAARVRIAQSSAGEGPIPFGAAAAVYFKGDVSTLKAQIDKALASAPPALSNALVYGIAPAEGGSVFTVSFNLGDGDVFGPAAALAPAEAALTFDPSTLETLSPEAEMLAGFGDVRVQTLPGETTSFMRASISKAPLQAMSARDYPFEPISNPDPCLDYLNYTVIETFGAMEKMAPNERMNAFDFYKGEIAACEARVASPHWDLVRARADTFTLLFGVEHDIALAGYKKACEESGDEAACAAKAHLERVGPPAPPQGAP